MVQRSGSQGHGKISFVQNNFYYDAFFLKAIVLNGACGSGLCVAPNKSTKASSNEASSFEPEQTFAEAVNASEDYPKKVFVRNSHWLRG